MSYRLTVRHGPRVERHSFETLGPAIATAREIATGVREEGPLEKVSMLRDYEPAQRVAARLEISRGGLLRSSSAGVDVMGDGELIAFAGGVRRRELELRRGEDAFDAVGRELR